MAVTILLGEVVTLLIKLYADFGTPHCYMVSCVHRKCQTPAGVSEDVNKFFGCATGADSKFYNRVLVLMIP